MNWKIKTSKGWYAVAMALFVVVSCGSNNGGADSILKGNISNGGVGETLKLEQLLPTKINLVDSAVINEDGSFAFTNVSVEEIGFYRVKQSDQNFITLIITPSDAINLNSPWNLGLSNYTVEGSLESNRLKELNERMAKMYTTQDSMQQVYQANQANEQLIMQLQAEFNLVANETREFAKQFITSDPASFACLAAAEQLDPETDGDLLRLVDENLGRKYPNSIYFTEFHKVIAKLDFLSPGSEVPDIILPNPQGEMKKLSDLRGKVVLIDFWASWCRPCRAENPNVVAAYNKYKDKGFEVFGVSLDQTQDRWVQAIEEDELNWTQVSDLKFWSSSVVKLYDIKGIPFAVLIDKEGKVIAKNLRGAALEEKLAEILN